MDSKLAVALAVVAVVWLLIMVTGIASLIRESRQRRRDRERWSAPRDRARYESLSGENQKYEPIWPKPIPPDWPDAGDRVLVARGPVAGCKATVLERDEDGKLTLSVEHPQRRIKMGAMPEVGLLLPCNCPPGLPHVGDYGEFTTAGCPVHG